MTSRLTLLLASALALCGTAAAAPLNLVTNGSFEQGTLNIGSFQSWQVTQTDGNTYVDSSGQTGTNYGQATDGKWAAYFGSSAATGGATIAQTLATTAGQLYTLAFDLANTNGGLAASNSVTVLINGVNVFSAMNLPEQNFVHEQASFFAASNATLTFSAYNNPGFVELDNVSITAAASTVTVTPEPSSLVLLLTGLAGVGGVLRKRFA